MRETEHLIAHITLILTMERYKATIVLLVMVMSLHGVGGAAVIHNDTDTFFWATVDMTEIRLYSPGNNETHRSNYTVNLTMEYFIEANYPNHTLQFNIYEFSLEEYKTDDCLYDRLTIYDGYNESSPIVKRLCNDISAGTKYYTTSDVAYLVFHSDFQLNYPGFVIGVQSYVPPTTTTMTTTTTTTRSTQSTSTKSTTTEKPTTTTTPVVTTSRGNTDDNSDSTIFIIIGCAVGGLLLLILVILIIICCMKSKKRRPESALSGDSNTKRVLWSRGSTMVQPLDFSKQAVPPGEIVQVKTNLFDLDLPTGQNKANLLPPISSRIP